MTSCQKGGGYERPNNKAPIFTVIELFNVNGGKRYQGKGRDLALNEREGVAGKIKAYLSEKPLGREEQCV